jgi:hypothetical protein
MGRTIMAKKKARKPSRMVVGIRGSEAWKKWLDEYAEFRRMTLVDLVDHALEEDAKRNGFRQPPRR